MAKSQRLQPKLRRIKEKYPNDQRKQQEETSALYQREGYSSMTGGCAPMLITLPVMMGVYFVNYKLLSFVLKFNDATVKALEAGVRAVPGLNEKTDLSAYRMQLTVISNWNNPSFNKAGLSTEVIEKMDKFVNSFHFLGMDLGRVPKTNMPLSDKLWLIPIITGIVSLAMAIYTYIRQKKTNPEMANNPSMGCMTFMSPAMSIWFSFMFPASVGVYIIMSTALSFVQMIILNHTHSPKKVLARLMVEETINHRAKEKVLKQVAENADKSEE